MAVAQIHQRHGVEFGRRVDLGNKTMIQLSQCISGNNPNIVADRALRSTSLHHQTAEGEVLKVTSKRLDRLVLSNFVEHSAHECSVVLLKAIGVPCLEAILCYSIRRGCAHDEGHEIALP